MISSRSRPSRSASRARIRLDRSSSPQKAHGARAGKMKGGTTRSSGRCPRTRSRRRTERREEVRKAHYQPKRQRHKALPGGAAAAGVKSAYATGAATPTDDWAAAAATDRVPTASRLYPPSRAAARSSPRPRPRPRPRPAPAPLASARAAHRSTRTTGTRCAGSLPTTTPTCSGEIDVHELMLLLIDLGSCPQARARTTASSLMAAASSPRWMPMATAPSPLTSCAGEEAHPATAAAAPRHRRRGRVTRRPDVAQLVVKVHLPRGPESESEAP